MDFGLVFGIPFRENRSVNSRVPAVQIRHREAARVQAKLHRQFRQGVEANRTWHLGQPISPFLPASPAIPATPSHYGDQSPQECRRREFVMRAISRRLQRLETRLVPQEDLRPWRIANRLCERRRRLAEVEGQQFEDLPPVPERGHTCPLWRRCAAAASNLPSYPTSCRLMPAAPELLPIMNIHA